MNKPTFTKVICILFGFCAATAIASPAQVLTTLHSFEGSDGFYPDAALIQATDGSFYGTTEDGGAYSYGTVFKMTLSGTLTTLYNFCPQIGYCPDGAIPYAGLIQATDGNFYGTTGWGGGAYGAGTVFELAPSGTLTTLHRFVGSDGSVPMAGLVQATDGNFYGTTSLGGANCSPFGCGTVFKITPSGALTTLHHFDDTDGAGPSALVQATDGNFYGTTSGGGANELGTVFEMTPSGTLTTLYSFCSQSNCGDGAYPYAGLVQASDGNFYGTTYGGGANGYGTVFKITPNGSLTTLYSFAGSDGINPAAGLAQATDGNFYGTTENGGANGYGTVFKITPSGTLTMLHSFAGSDGINPVASLVQATDRNFYGTTRAGGANGYGTVFRLVTVRACIVCPSVK